MVVDLGILWGQDSRFSGLLKFANFPGHGVNYFKGGERLGTVGRVGWPHFLRIYQGESRRGCPPGCLRSCAPACIRRCPAWAGGGGVSLLCGRVCIIQITPLTLTVRLLTNVDVLLQTSWTRRQARQGVFFIPTAGVCAVGDRPWLFSNWSRCCRGRT